MTTVASLLYTCGRLSRSDRGLSAVDYDEHMLPGEAVLLNGQSSSNKTVTSRPPVIKDDTVTATSLYGCRLNWDETHQQQQQQQQQQHVIAVGDCPTCRDTSNVVADDSEVCFTEELVRRKLLLGRCPSSLLHVAESQYDTVPMTDAASSAELLMRTFKGHTAASSCRTSLPLTTDHCQ